MISTMKLPTSPRTYCTLVILMILLSFYGISIEAVSQTSSADTVAGTNTTRTVPQAASIPYKPSRVSCETTPGAKLALPFKDASGLEQQWSTARNKVAQASWATFFPNLGLPGFDSPTAKGKLPRVAIAVSGGGYRAMLTGAGVIKAMDSRNATAVRKKTGGLLQASTFLASISGGSWLAALLLDQNGVSVDNWQLDISEGLFTGKDYVAVNAEVTAKQTAGFNVSLVDAYGRLLSQELYPRDGPWRSETLSSLRQRTAISQHKFPLPILLAAAKPGASASYDPDAVPLEYTVFTTGASTKKVNAFVKTSLLGTKVSGGVAAGGNMCVEGFDNLGFLVGTSSAAFAVDGSVASATSNNPSLARTPGNQQNSARIPNPFKGLKFGSQWDVDELFVGDGALGSWSNIPFPPLINPERDVDVIFAIDSGSPPSGAGFGYPDGSSLIKASRYAKKNDIPFPDVPTTQQFASAGIGRRITFFGCNNPSGLRIVYIPNRKVTYDSGSFNVFQLQAPQQQVRAMVENGFNLLTQGDAPTCIGCILSSYTGYTSTVCNQCLAKYCWPSKV